MITTNQIARNLLDFMFFSIPSAPVVANAAAKGAVIADEKPAAKRPIAINHLAQDPRIGSTAIAISPPFATSRPVRFAAATMIIAIDTRPPRPIEITVSILALITSSLLADVHLSEEEDACKNKL